MGWKNPGLLNDMESIFYLGKCLFCVWLSVPLTFFKKAKVPWAPSSQLREGNLHSHVSDESHGLKLEISIVGIACPQDTCFVDERFVWLL